MFDIPNSRKPLFRTGNTFVDRSIIIDNDVQLLGTTINIERTQAMLKVVPGIVVYDDNIDVHLLKKRNKPQFPN
jgi:hypothetical protein